MLTSTAQPTVARSQANGVATATTRSGAIDNLRVALTALVIAHHVGQAYGPTGGDWPVFNAERSAILGPFFSVNAAFFMGLFFLLAGYFTPPAYGRKGTLAFVRDRLLRLGVPLLLVVLAFAPLSYLESDRSLPFGSYFFQVYLGQQRGEFAHLWFVAHLLVYAWAMPPGNCLRHACSCQAASRTSQPTARSWGLCYYSAA